MEEKKPGQKLGQVLLCNIVTGQDLIPSVFCSRLPGFYQVTKSFFLTVPFPIPYLPTPRRVTVTVKLTAKTREGTRRKKGEGGRKRDIQEIFKK
jgi:hypothetical protein